MLFGTVDSYLIWRLTGGAAHVTDATNAARTMLYDIHDGRWSEEICEAARYPDGDVARGEGLRGRVRGDGVIFSGADSHSGGRGRSAGGDGGAGLFPAGHDEIDLWDGVFRAVEHGRCARAYRTNRLLTTIAYRLERHGPTYALEGSIFIAGAVVQWLRDGLQIITDAGETQGLAEASDAGQPVVIVPAFTGLGAPYWNPDCRGAVFGLSRNSGPAEFARAALESVGYQTRDLLEAMQADGASGGDAVLRVDGGMTASDWTMQFLADILGAPVDRPQVLETTALGAAWLAGMQAGVYPDQAGFAESWALERRFEPAMHDDARDEKYARWKAAVAATMSV